jgi:hypothetical protein
MISSCGMLVSTKVLQLPSVCLPSTLTVKRHRTQERSVQMNGQQRSPFAEDLGWRYVQWHFSYPTQMSLDNRNFYSESTVCDIQTSILLVVNVTLNVIVYTEFVGYDLMTIVDS